MSSGVNRVDIKKVNLQTLVGLATPDHHIQHLKQSDAGLYNALKNMGTAVGQIINNNFPAAPNFPYYGRIIIPGIQVVGTNILAHTYHFTLPIDPLQNWICESVTIDLCTTTLKIASAAGPYILDVLVQQNSGVLAQTPTEPFKTIFKVGKRPTIPQGFLSAKNVDFGINTFYNDDTIRVDVITADGTASGAECLLTGHYNWRQN